MCNKINLMCLYMHLSFVLQVLVQSWGKCPVNFNELKIWMGDVPPSPTTYIASLLLILLKC